MAKQVIVKLENHFQNGEEPNRQKAEQKLYLCIRQGGKDNV